LAAEYVAAILKAGVPFGVGREPGDNQGVFVGLFPTDTTNGDRNDGKGDPGEDPIKQGTGVGSLFLGVLRGDGRATPELRSMQTTIIVGTAIES
jgi:hypothetical protein